jgi:adenine/guanine phosphoribosyltransferase-like PRPP-binding protein
MSAERETYRVEICGLVRQLPLFDVGPGVRIAVLNLLGDVELTRAVAAALAERLADRKVEVVVTAETKSVPLAYEIASLMSLPYVVLRKSYKPYMGDALSERTASISTGSFQVLYLDEKDRGMIAGKRIAIVDDVISTGSMLDAMRRLTKGAGARIVAEAAVFTEGDPSAWRGIIALGHLPLFKTESEQ